MTYKSFIMTLPDDLEPSKFQSLYEEYQAQYLNDFSNAFFHISKTEEWFQERYNPVKIKERDESNAAWASTESVLFRDQMLENAGKTVRNLRLGPRPAAKAGATATATGVVGDGSGGDDNAVVAEMATGEEEEGDNNHDGDGDNSAAMMATDNAGGDETAVTAAAAAGGGGGVHIPFQTRTIKGHDNTCVFVAGVHACCTKAIFRSSVNEALSSTGLALPSRVLVGQPVWVGRPNRFEKCAWVIFPTANDAKKGLKILREMRFGVPGKMDREKGEATLLFTFSVDAMTLKPPKNVFAYDYCSRQPRVQADEASALELAALLDGERGVDEDATLAATLAQPSLQEHLTEPTDTLDVAIAYLRRVHFVSFYAGKRFLDEAHMLAISPTPIRRQLPYMTVEEEEAEKASMLQVQEAAKAAVAVEATEASSKSKRKRENDDGDEDDAAAAAADAVDMDKEELNDAADADDTAAEEGGAAKVDSADDAAAADGEGESMAVEEGAKEGGGAAAAAAAANPNPNSVSNRLLAKLGHKVYPLKDKKLQGLIRDLKEGRLYVLYSVLCSPFLPSFSRV
jgi:hypothetical protein